MRNQEDSLAFPRRQSSPAEATRARLSLTLATGLAILAAASLQGCGRNTQPDTARVILEFQHKESASLLSPNADLSALMSSSSVGPLEGAMSLGGAPWPVSSFDCMAVNIMGAGIPTSDRKEQDRNRDISVIINNLIANPSYYCAYPGITTIPIHPTGGTQSAELIVPTGTNRIIQLVGFLDNKSGMCSATVPLGDVDMTNTHEDVFEMGRVVQGIFTDTTVQVPNMWGVGTNHFSRSLQCGDGNSNALTLHWDASTITGKAAGAAITEWIDVMKSLSAKEDSSSGGGVSPTYSVAGPNNKPVINFGHSGGTMPLKAAGSSALGVVSDFAIYVVAEQTLGTSLKISNSDGNQISILRPDTNSFQASVSGTSPLSITPATMSGLHIYSLRWNHSTYGSCPSQCGTISFRVDGGTAATTTMGSPSLFANATTDINIAPDLDGSVAEIMIYPHYFWDSDETRVICYLAKKYGIPVSACS